MEDLMKKIVLSLLVLTSVANTHVNIKAMETRKAVLTENCDEILGNAKKSYDTAMDSAKKILSEDSDFTKFKKTLVICKDSWMEEINSLNAKYKMTNKQLVLYRREAAIWTLKQVEYLEIFFKDKQKHEGWDAFLSNVEVLRNTVQPNRIDKKIMKKVEEVALPFINNTKGRCRGIYNNTKDRFLGVCNTAAQSFKHRLSRKQGKRAVNPVKASQAPATQPAPAVNPA